MNLGSSSVSRTVETSLTYDLGHLWVEDTGDTVVIQVDTNSKTIKVSLSGSVTKETIYTFSEFYNLLQS